jgi:hypothetical protein
MRAPLARLCAELVALATAEIARAVARAVGEARSALATQATAHDGEPLLTTTDIEALVGVEARAVPRWLRNHGVVPHARLPRGRRGAPVFCYRWPDLIDVLGDDGVWVSRDRTPRPSYAETPQLVLERESLQRALATIPERRARAVVLAIVAEWTLEEVGRELGVTRERARQLRDLGLQSLRVAYGLDPLRRKRGPPPVLVEARKTELRQAAIRTELSPRPCPSAAAQRRVSVEPRQHPTALSTEFQLNLASVVVAELGRELLGTVVAAEPWPWTRETRVTLQSVAPYVAGDGYPIADVAQLHALVGASGAASTDDAIASLNAAFDPRPTIGAP